MVDVGVSEDDTTRHGQVRGSAEFGDTGVERSIGTPKAEEELAGV